MKGFKMIKELQEAKRIYPSETLTFLRQQQTKEIVRNLKKIITDYENNVDRFSSPRDLVGLNNALSISLLGEDGREFYLDCDKYNLSYDDFDQLED